MLKINAERTLQASATNVMTIQTASSVERSKLGPWRDGHVIDGKLHQWKRTVCLLEKDQGRNRIFFRMFSMCFSKIILWF